MAFAISTRGLKRITNYTDAKAHYDSIKPIKGRSVDIRPAGDRRKDHMQVVLGEDRYGEYVAFQLYTTEVVRHYKDGSIRLSVGYASQSTVAFANQYLPYQFRVQLKQDNILLNVSKDGVNHWYDHRLSLFFIGPDGAVRDPEPVYVKRTDRTKAKAARVKVQAFREWLGTVGTLLMETLTEDGWVGLRDTFPVVPRHSCASSWLLQMAESNDPDRFMQIFLSWGYFSAYARKVSFPVAKVLNEIDAELLQREGAYYYEPVPSTAYPPNGYKRGRYVESV